MHKNGTLNNMDFEYENSVFAHTANSTMKRRRALQWPESVLVGNPYSGTMLKHIKTFSIIFFCVAPIPSNILPWEVCPRTDFLGIFWQNFWHFLKKRPAVAGV